jgi:hypothetical protein
MDIMITADQLREHVHYDPETGIFTPVKSRSGVRTVVLGSTTGRYLRFELLGHIHANHVWAWLYMTGAFPEKPLQIDHINGEKDDNRWENLRLGPAQHNCWNRRSVAGYSWNKKDQKYKARIMVSGRAVSLGSYQTWAEARAAYLTAKDKLHAIPEKGVSHG